jgi:hypothetical protein
VDAATEGTPSCLNLLQAALAEEFGRCRYSTFAPLLREVCGVEPAGAEGSCVTSTVRLLRALRLADPTLEAYPCASTVPSFCAQFSRQSSNRSSRDSIVSAGEAEPPAGLPFVDTEPDPLRHTLVVVRVNSGWVLLDPAFQVSTPIVLTSKTDFQAEYEWATSELLLSPSRGASWQFCVSDDATHITMSITCSAGSVTYGMRVDLRAVAEPALPSLEPLLTLSCGRLELVRSCCAGGKLCHLSLRCDRRYVELMQNGKWRDRLCWDDVAVAEDPVARLVEWITPDGVEQFELVDAMQTLCLTAAVIVAEAEANGSRGTTADSSPDATTAAFPDATAKGLALADLSLGTAAGGIRVAGLGLCPEGAANRSSLKSAAECEAEAEAEAAYCLDG